MPRIILFTLWAPLAAMGDVAVGERRGGFDRPARSAVLGLVAAALGYERTAEAKHAALETGYALALRVLAPGQLVQDYHTVQAPPARRGKRWPTRAAALAEPRLETLLSRRDYRADPVVTVALVPRAGADPVPDRVATALRQPHFAPYFGRKACPLGLPLAPLAVEAADLAQAYRAYDDQAGEPERRLLSSLRLGADRATLYGDLDLLEPGIDMIRPGFEVLRIERRRDRIASRRRWQFDLRDEVVAKPARRESEP
jgi:CRISPR system Cascade subunit CasD